MHKQTQKRRASRQQITADRRPNFISRANIVLSRKQGLLNTPSKTLRTQSQASHTLTFLPLTTPHAQTHEHHAQQTQGTCKYLLPTHGLSLLAEVTAGHHKAVLPDETVVGAGAPAAQHHRRPHPNALAETFKHFIFYDTYTSMCGPAFAKIYRGAKERCVRKRQEKKMQCERERNLESYNIHRFTLLPISSTAQNES